MELDKEKLNQMCEVGVQLADMMIESNCVETGINLENTDAGNKGFKVLVCILYESDEIAFFESKKRAKENNLKRRFVKRIETEV